MKNSTDEATTSILWSRLSPHQSPSSYIVKNVLIDNINTMNVHNTYVTIAIDKHQDTEYLTVRKDIEVGDFNHSGGYCYELFSSLTHAYHAFSLLFFIYDRQVFTTR